MMINEKISRFLQQNFNFTEQAISHLGEQEHIQKKVKDLLLLLTTNKDQESQLFVQQQMEGILSTLTANVNPFSATLRKERMRYYSFC